MLNNHPDILADNYLGKRQLTLSLTEALSPEDMVIQSMEDASPTKWHLAHTTWFFETFVLKVYKRHYSEFNESFAYLFNSYYESLGDRQPRFLRGMLTRPCIDTVLAYRHHIDHEVLSLLQSDHPEKRAIENRIRLGLHHEMQHQELLLTDILHAFSTNPIFPAVRASTNGSFSRHTDSADIEALQFISFEGGLHKTGADGTGFYFDCESPRHDSYIREFALANRLITNAEWIEFIEDNGYYQAALWLSDGWAQRKKNPWSAPLYWIKKDDRWHQFSLFGLHSVQLNEPVCHISYFEADAFARWRGDRLPTEQEWELAAQSQPVSGNFLESGHLQPQPATTFSDQAAPLQQLYGDVWEWTRSSFSPYPGFKPASGAVGEYNGKFMSGQLVLRGGSCVTPQQQLRPSYRNFFYPHQRWQFSGLRLARDL